ncbi:hypothetical protein [Stenotrophomonas acidaminiphila]|nr:hypothetical protein [Stenotrophomonas acidaminiphila]
MNGTDVLDDYLGELLLDAMPAPAPIQAVYYTYLTLPTRRIV